MSTPVFFFFQQQGGLMNLVFLGTIIMTELPHIGP